MNGDGMHVNDPLKSAAQGLTQIGVLQVLRPFGSEYQINPAPVMDPHVIVIADVNRMTAMRRVQEEIALLELRHHLKEIQER